MKRNNSMKTLVVTFILTIIASTGFTQDKVIDQVVAVVGDKIVLKSDIEDTNIQWQLSGQTSEGDAKCEILEEFLIDKLLIAEAELDTTIEVTPSQVNQQTDAYMQSLIARAGSESALEAAIKKPIATYRAEMQEGIKNNILSSQMRNKIIENVDITPSEVRLDYRNLKEDEIPEIPTQYEYEQITFKPEITLEEENRVKAELRELKRRIEDGERSFSSLAIMYSEGAYRTDGGELPYMGRAELSEPLAAVAFNLRDDRVSNVIKDDMGYHIIQLVNRQGEKVKIRDILMKPKISAEAKEEAFNRMDSLANMIRENKVTFEEAAGVVSSDIKTRNNGGMAINPNTLSSKFAVEDLDPDVSKILPSLKINEISDPFETIDEDSQQTVYKIIARFGHTGSYIENRRIVVINKR